MPRTAVIPFKNELEMTRNMVDTLLNQNELDRLYLFDNGSDESVTEQLSVRWGPVVEYILAPNDGIYSMWNRGISKSVEDFGPSVYVSVLNNDIEFGDHFIASMGYFLDVNPEHGIVYPNYDLPLEESSPWAMASRDTRGTYKDGGMGGWAWTLRGQLWHDRLIPPIDENLKWWFGDDFIELHVRKAGFKVARLLHLAVQHRNEATANNGENDWTHSAKAADIGYWNSTYA